MFSNLNQVPFDGFNSLEKNQTLIIYHFLSQASPRTVKLNGMVEVAVSFKNPLPVALKNGQFHLEATGMSPKSIVIDCRYVSRQSLVTNKSILFPNHKKSSTYHEVLFSQKVKLDLVLKCFLISFYVNLPFNTLHVSICHLLIPSLQ